MLQAASTVDEFEALYQLMRARGTWAELLLQLPSVPAVPLYPFPLTALPPEVQQSIVATDTSRLIGGMGQATSAFFAARINRANQPGLTLNVWEYWLFAFAWFATQSEGDDGKSGSRSDAFMYKTNINALYSCLLRQYALVLLEAQATSHQSVGRSRGLGYSLNSAPSSHAGEGPFQVLAATLTELWLQQNSAEFFVSINASLGASAGRTSSAFVLRSKYRAPTFLVLCGLHDFVTLLVHTASEVAVFHQSDASRYRADLGATQSTADRIAGVVLRDMIIDPLYRTLKLGLLLAPPMWPYLVSVWQLVAAPWRHSPAPDAYAKLTVLHERKQALAIGFGFAPAGARVDAAKTAAEEEEEFPFSTLVLSPYDPASLKSPFLLPPPRKSASSTTGSSGASAAAAIFSGFNLASVFGAAPTASSSSSLSSASSLSSSSSSPSSASALAVLSLPQNWGWFTFFDVTKPVGAWPPATGHAMGSAGTAIGAASGVLSSVESGASRLGYVTASAELSMEYRGYVAYNFALYTPLLRAWIAAARELFVQQSQPLNPLFLIALSNALRFFRAPPLVTLLHEMGEAMRAPADHHYGGVTRASSSTEMEQRIVAERWAHLEHCVFPHTAVDGGLSGERVLSDLLRECHRFVRMAAVSGWSLWGASTQAADAAVLRQSMADVTECAVALFALDAVALDRQLAQDADDDKAQQQQSQAQRHAQLGGLGGSAGGPLFGAPLNRHMQPLTDEQRAQLRMGQLRMDRGRVSFEGDPWAKPVASFESPLLLWLLLRVSVLLGLVDPSTRKTYLNLRPLGKRAVVWGLVGLLVCAWLLARLGSLDLGSLLAADDGEDE